MEVLIRTVCANLSDHPKSVGVSERMIPLESSATGIERLIRLYKSVTW